MTIKVGSGGSALPKLAPDLTWPTDMENNVGYERISGIDGSAGLVTALSLTGKFMISLLQFTSILTESITYKLTIDGVVIWNGAAATGTVKKLLGSKSGPNEVSNSIQCDASLLLEVQTTTDTNVVLDYLVRPIL